VRARGIAALASAVLVFALFLPWEGTSGWQLARMFSAHLGERGDSGLVVWALFALTLVGAAAGALGLLAALSGRPWPARLGAVVAFGSWAAFFVYLFSHGRRGGTGLAESLFQGSFRQAGGLYLTLAMIVIQLVASLAWRRRALLTDTW
jgi:hypothetical protein